MTTSPFSSKVDLDRLLDHKTTESPSLEFKRQLDMNTPAQRAEVLKDLTAMANGGGGTVLFGVDEAHGEWPAADRLTPLTDRSLVARLEDVVRDGVRPPLLFDLGVLELDEGFVLVANVDTSPLGPYMVTANGTFRYHRRIGRRTEPMDERQVRDAYSLALRGREHRAVLWEEHFLPLAPPSDEPWLMVSALPEEPLLNLVDLTTVNPTDVRPPEEIKRHVNIGNFWPAADRLGRWADGLYGDNGYGERVPSSMVRLHRDGAAAIGVEVHGESLPVVGVARVVNAQLAYLGWFWKEFALRRPVELRLELTSLTNCTLETGPFQSDQVAVRQPHGVDIPTMSVTEHLLPWDLVRAPVRHRLVQTFVDRLHHAFGRPFLGQLFRTGQLYGSQGQPLGCSVAGRGVWRADGSQLGRVHTDGSVTKVAEAELVGWWFDGSLVDRDGRTLGVVEMSPGAGVPSDFLPTGVLTDPRARVPGGNAGDAEAPLSTSTDPAPTFTGTWSPSVDLVALFDVTDHDGDGP